ncbi:hypothetical protein PR202_ga11865 [Eleusine coracana subsp. coracana]|uniref:Uncharacterized protein n=1 Tax=Eleusine coracana subsp. coracana TaxID=191504 RepID=A0AAV5CAK0_ELECO|nr:hypothetical protein PR202_ga11865 [Eleusine coracana subsp. coracana]
MEHRRPPPAQTKEADARGGAMLAAPGQFCAQRPDQFFLGAVRGGGAVRAPLNLGQTRVTRLRRREMEAADPLEYELQRGISDIMVDVLGDEVDTLLSVLGKIYIALDHYSPVLKHYPGVIDILRIVQKVLQGESI